MKMKIFIQILTGIILISCSVCSCATGTGENASSILGSSSETPVFLSCKAVSETEINFEFSLPVKVKTLNFSPQIEFETTGEGNIVIVTFSGGPGPGEKLTADLLAEDENGNTINVLVPLRTKNSRIPNLIITELRTEYSKPKCEFIEFKTLEGGNLGAVKVYIAGNIKEPLLYEFPPIETAAGEYITLHLRTTEDSNCNELGTNLAESGGADSAATGRDIWIPGSTKLLRKTDIIYFLDQDDNVIDAVMLAENKDTWWNKDYLAEAAEFLYIKDSWASPDGKICSPADAVQTTGTTATRTICRDETLEKNSQTAADWYITATSCATPGMPNNSKRYN